MLARGAIHNPKIFEEYKNLPLEEYFENSEDRAALDNDYEEVKDEEEISKFAKNKNTNDSDVKVSYKLTKIFEKKYINREIDIVPILREYVEIALKTGNNFHNSKYIVLYILKTHKKYVELFRKIQNSKNYKEMSELLDIKDKFEYYVKSCENMPRYYDNFYYRDKFRLNLDKSKISN